MFRPVLAQHGSHLVFEQIRQSIEDGTYGPCCRLPSERELAASFGVSRATIREAIKSLASLGLLEVRQGVGTIVSPGSTTLEDPSYWLPWLTAHRKDVIALLEVREALEAKSAALAARSVSNGVPGGGALLEELGANLAGMEEATRRRDLVTLERLDLEFHALLAQLSGNHHLLRLSKSINHVFSDRRAAMSIPGRAERSCVEHARIVTAVRDGLSSEASEAMVTHLSSTLISVAKVQGKGTNQ